MGENLARLLISSYGGHMWRLRKALYALTRTKADFILREELNPIFEKIDAITTVFPNEGTRLLHEMAEFRFASVENTTDPAVELIVKSNVGGTVQETGSEVVGLPESVFDSCQLGLVPT